MNVLLERDWKDRNGVRYAQGESVEVDTVTLAELESTGHVATHDHEERVANMTRRASDGDMTGTIPQNAPDSAAAESGVESATTRPPAAAEPAVEASASDRPRGEGANLQLLTETGTPKEHFTSVRMGPGAPPAAEVTC